MDPLVGTSINQYRLLSVLGTGGMGVVYEAVDTGLDRQVALKLPPAPTAHDGNTKARFLQEARAVAALDHVNVGSIFEVGTTEDGRPFFVMALYKGQALDELIANGPVDPNQARSIARQTAEGLDAAHRAGIIHRDIKPANIFVTEGGTVKILDFGVAKMADQQALTAEGSTVGTLVYMSPEQAQGEVLNESSDIWSVGAVLYEMLAGVRAFNSRYPQAALYAILHSDPEPLPAEIPADLRGVVQRCLEKTPKERYSSAAELGDALAAPDSSSTRYRSPRPRNTKSRRRRVATVGVLTALIALAALVVRNALEPALAAEDLRIIVLPFEDFSPGDGQEAMAAGFAQLLTDGFARRGVTTIGAATGRDHRRNGSTTEEIVRQVDVDYVLTGTVLQTADALTITAELVDREVRAIWQHPFEGSGDDFPAFRDDILAAVIDEIGLGQPAGLADWEPSASLLRKYMQADLLKWEQDPEFVVRAMRLYDDIIAEEPRYLKSYAGYAHSASILLELGQPLPDGWDRVMELSSQAWEMDSTNVYALLTTSAATLPWDYKRAQELVERAFHIDPNNLDVMFELSTFSGGHLELQRILYDRDPKNRQNLTNLAAGVALEGDMEGGLEIFEQLEALDPNYRGVKSQLPAWATYRGQGEDVVLAAFEDSRRTFGPSGYLALASLMGGSGLTLMPPGLEELASSDSVSPAAKMVYFSWFQDGFQDAYSAAATAASSMSVVDRYLLQQMVSWTSPGFQADSRYPDLVDGL